MKITQAAASAVKVAEDQWMTLIALNDQEGGPEGVRVNIVNVQLIILISTKQVPQLIIRTTTKNHHDPKIF